MYSLQHIYVALVLFLGPLRPNKMLEVDISITYDFIGEEMINWISNEIIIQTSKKNIGGF